MRAVCRFALTLVLPLLAGTAALAAEKPTADQIEFFESQVRPVLFANCFACHGKEQQAAGLRLDSLAAVLKGGARGPAVVKGDAAKSLLVKAIRHEGGLKMPPTGKLKDPEIAALTTWVKMGAPWPEAKVSPEAKKAVEGDYEITERQRSFWSFRPVKKPAVPKVKAPAWIRTPVDAFILAKLEAKGLKPNPPADRRTLIRRATYNLTGLPPTPAQVDAFLNDKSPNAWEKVVDRLLASPRYGEKWGRMWLDIARYADTKGYTFQEDPKYHHAYTYRDYVVRAFNDDKPYDRFVKEQLAADKLPLSPERRELAATGFLTLGRRFLGAQEDIVDDRIDVVTRGLMGLTVACARCHDHKYDPIPTKDYYSLYGVFNSSIEPGPQPFGPKEKVEAWLGHNQKVQNLKNERDALIKAQFEALKPKKETLPKDVMEAIQRVFDGAIPNGDNLKTIEPHFEAAAREKLTQIRAQIDATEKAAPPAPEMAMALQDHSQPGNVRVFKRGNPGNQGDEAPRRFLRILAGDSPPPFTKGSGRLELAEAIASPKNPLTARVMVNRIWQGHFSEGLVRTSSDFGVRGEPPTHPELLDWLATRFVESGWSIKKMHRLLMLSSVYQQGNAVDPKAARLDPENRLLASFPRRRLTIEELRDSLLMASGRLDLTLGGPSVEITRPPFPRRRTLYGFIDRLNLQSFYRTFDFANPDSTTGKRYNTTVPQQALYMMNSPFVVENARELIRRPEVAAVPDEAKRVRLVYREVYGRWPSTEEVSLALDFLKSARTLDDAPEVAARAWQQGYGFLDEQKGRVTQFTPLPHWDGRRWQGSARFPDPKLQFLVLTPTGGHAGADARHAAIRRWTAPRDMVVGISGKLKHEAGQAGDGVRARVVSSRGGVAGEWTAHMSEAETLVAKVEVKKGDTLDFVTDCRAEHTNDSFMWAPVIAELPPALSPSINDGNNSAGPTRAKNGGNKPAAPVFAKSEGHSPAAVVRAKNDENKAPASRSLARWHAGRDFSGPQGEIRPLTEWEEYAQALLMTNEFAFVD
jgi:mono/diheme cytochrome c family protein